MLTTAQLMPLVRGALRSVLAHLADDGTELPDDLGAQVRLYGRIKAQRGGPGVADALGLEPAELPLFDAAVRDVERTGTRLSEGAPHAERNAVIAYVRLLSWLETIGQRTPALALDAAIDRAVSEDVGRKQVRALELIVRSLITESYGDQQTLVARLREALGDGVIDKWLRAADAGDVLSGCTFGELASLFVNREEFARYERLYEDTPFLTLLRQRRRTVQSFLDDVRRIRNVLAHNKQISNVQLALLDIYYEEIVAPVQTAHDEGETAVDPAAHLEVSREELTGYFEGLREDVLSVKEDLGELRESLVSALGDVKADTERIHTATQGANRKLLWIGGGVVVLIGAVVWLLSQGDKTQDEVERTRQTSERTEAAAHKTAEEVAAIGRRGEETAADVAKATDAIDRSTETMDAAAKEAKAAAERIEKTTERVAQTLEELRAGFVALTKTGGLIADARRPQEHYHNARVLEQQGDYPKAMRSYRLFFAVQGEAFEFVDPHLRFQRLLKLQSGIGGAREAYHEVRKERSTRVTEFAWLLLLDPDARVKGLEAFLAAHPTFAPALYELSLDFSVARLGTQALADKRREKQLLTAFLALEKEGQILRYYLDQSVAAEQVEDARERMAALDAISDAAFEHPVTMSASRSNAGWMITLSIADQAKEIFYRVGDEGEFKSTGFVSGVRSRSGLPLPMPSIPLQRSEMTTVHVRYKDLRDREHGPYALEFDPDRMLLESVKGTIGLTRNSWVAFRDYDGKVLLYFTHLLSYRAALKEIRYGLDIDAPDRTLPFSPADPKNPYAIGPDDTVYLEVPAATKYVTVQLVFKDDTETEVGRFER